MTEQVSSPSQLAVVGRGVYSSTAVHDYSKPIQFKQRPYFNKEE